MATQSTPHSAEPWDCNTMFVIVCQTLFIVLVKMIGTLRLTVSLFMALFFLNFLFTVSLYTSVSKKSLTQTSQLPQTSNDSLEEVQEEEPISANSYSIVEILIFYELGSWSQKILYSYIEDMEHPPPLEKIFQT